MYANNNISNNGEESNITNNNVPSLYTSYDVFKIKFESGTGELRSIQTPESIPIVQTIGSHLLDPPKPNVSILDQLLAPPLTRLEAATSTEVVPAPILPVSIPNPVQPIRTIRLMPTYPLRYPQYTFDGDETWHGFLGWISDARFIGDKDGNLTIADRHVILTTLSKCYALIVNGSRPMALYRGNSDCLYALQGTPKEYPQVFWVSQPTEIIRGVATFVPDRPIKVTNFCRYIEEISYNGVTMEPYHLDQPKTSSGRFNTFSGFKARLTHPDPQPEDMAKIQIILDHIRTVWAGGNEDLYWYILSWFAYPIRTLKAAQKVLVITGLPGCGKSRVFEFFDAHVYGDALSHTYKDLSGMEKTDFNDEIIGKMRAHVSEIVNKGQTHVSGNTWNKLKDLITGRTLTCHPIYCAKYTIPNVITWSFTSNHDDCIMLENEDRRYIIIKCAETYKGNRDYFIALSAAFTDEAGSIMYSYLRSDAFGAHMIDIPTAAIPVTQAKLNMIEASRPILYDFIADVFETGSYDVPVDFIHNIAKEDGAASDQFITSTDLYKLYSEWARSTGNKVRTQRAISNFIKSVARFPIDLKRIGGNPHKGFFIPETYRANISIVDNSFSYGASRTAGGHRNNSHAATSGH